MLVVVIVIAILGTNLLLGFFVANTMGYGPQTLSELMTGIYKAPIGWTIRKLTKGQLDSEVRRQWVQQWGSYCVLPSDGLDAESTDTESDSDDSPDEDAQADGTSDGVDDDDEAESFGDDEPSAEGDVSGTNNDLLLLRQVIQFVQTSPVLLDELRFQWKYLPNDDTESESTAESVDSEAAESEHEAASEDLSDEDQTDNSLAAEEDSDDQDHTDEDSAPLWTKDRLAESVKRWNEYLEAYQPSEVTWWLDWFQKWEAFAEAWRKHCTEILAVGLVERLLHENKKEPEAVVPAGPQSVKSAKQSPKESEQPAAATVNPKQDWIRSQYSRLLQSLYTSSAELQNAQGELLQFTLEQALTQWDAAYRSEHQLPQSLNEVLCLSPLLDLSLAEDFKPNHLVLIVPDYRRLLDLDNGKLISAVVDSSLFRSLHNWVQDESVPGQWYKTNQNWAIGLIDSDEATVRQKASWISESLAVANFQRAEYSLSQTCNVVICPLADGSEVMDQITKMLDLINRRPIQSRMAVGNTVWQVHGKKLRAIAKDETEIEAFDIGLGFDGIAMVNDLPDLSDMGGDLGGGIDESEDW